MKMWLAPCFNTGRQEAELPGHAQVDHEGAPVLGDDGQLLAAARELGNAGAGQERPRARGPSIVRCADVRASEAHGRDHAPDERAQRAADGLDLGEFRHDGV
jgi:hypothetical protein